MADLSLEVEDVAQIVDRFGGMEGKKKPFRGVVGFERAADALKGLPR